MNVRGMSERTSTAESAGPRCDEPLDDAAPVLPRADVGVGVEELVEVGRQLPDEARTQRVVVGAFVGPVRDLDEERGRGVAVGLGASPALDVSDASVGLDLDVGRGHGGGAYATARTGSNVLREGCDVMPHGAVRARA
jgi:hypothetical protein